MTEKRKIALCSIRSRTSPDGYIGFYAVTYTLNENHDWIPISSMTYDTALDALNAAIKNSYDSQYVLRVENIDGLK